MILPLPVYLFGLLQLLAISWIDLKTKKISNWWLLVNVLASVSVIFVYPELYSLNWMSGLYPLGFILIGFPLFLLGIMGAGDSKYLAGLFLIIPVGLQHVFFLKLVASTISCAFILLTIRVIRHYKLVLWIFKTAQWSEFKQLQGSRFSYAPVILLAWIWLLKDIL